MVTRDCGQGRYRLEAVDATGRLIAGVVAVTEISEEAAEAGAGGFAAEEVPAEQPRVRTELTELTGVIQQQTQALVQQQAMLVQANTQSQQAIVQMSQTLCEGFQAMVGAFSPVKAGAAPILFGTEAPGAPVDAKSMPEKVKEYVELGQIFLQNIGNVVTAFKGVAANAAAASAPPPVPPPVEPTQPADAPSATEGVGSAL